MNITENDYLRVKEQNEQLNDEIRKLCVETMSLINQNAELNIALEKCAYWLINVAIKNDIGFECLQKVQELLGDKRYDEIVEAAKQHVKDSKDFQNGWKKDISN